jgi:hypothetical protein
MRGLLSLQILPLSFALKVRVLVVNRVVLMFGERTKTMRPSSPINTSRSDRHENKKCRENNTLKNNALYLLDCRGDHVIPHPFLDFCIHDVAVE